MAKKRKSLPRSWWQNYWARIGPVDICLIAGVVIGLLAYYVGELLPLHAVIMGLVVAIGLLEIFVGTSPRDQD